MKTIATITALAIALAGCSTASKNIATAYVSPIQYQNYDCEQLGAESRRLTGRAQQVGVRLDEAASNDQAIMAVSLILFWPAAFALGGTKGQEAEYARLRGEADAVHEAAIARKCMSDSPIPTAAQAAAAAKVGAPAPAPRAFRPASCDWPGVKQGVGAC